MRNYKNEAKWAKEKYERIDAKIDKEIGNKLKELLKKDKITISTWVFENAIHYINLRKKDR